MELSKASFGVRRRLEIVGFLEWNNVHKFIICQFYVQSISPAGILLIDKDINQNREVRYVLSNEKKVDTNFNTVTTGGQGEYDFFFNYLQTNLLVPSYNLLATKLNERGIFN